MIIEGPVFCLEEFRSLSDIHAAFQEMSGIVASEIRNRCSGISVKAVWLREKENSWSTSADLMRFCVECDTSKSDDIQVKPTEYINGPSAISKIVEREIPAFIKKLHET